MCAFYYFRLIYIRKPEHLSHNGHADLFLSLSKVEILTLTAFTIVLVLTMDKICTISDESDTSGDQEDTEHVKVNQGATVSRSEHFLRVQQPSRGESVSRLGPVGKCTNAFSCIIYSVSRTHKHKVKNMSSSFVSKETRVEMMNFH